MMPMMFPFSGLAFGGLAIVLVAIVIVAVLWAAWPGTDGRTSAEEALRLRYARGEIDAEEYTHRLTTLRRIG